MNTRSKAPLVILIVLLVIALGIGAGYFAWYWTSGTITPPVQRVETTMTTVPSPSDPITAPTTATPLPPNPVDFATLKAANPDIYAWVYVPGTNVDHPVVCATDQEDGYYLHRNIYKQYEFAGTIYSEKKNGTDMMHRNTVLYGHNMLNGTMFRTLHNFEDPEFFDEFDTIYIYTSGHIYTYTIFAAYQYDDRHLLNSFDYSNDQVWSDYLAFATNPKSMIVNTRDVPVSISDRIVTLSTCVSSTNKTARYLVQGVLVHDQPTQP